MRRPCPFCNKEGTHYFDTFDFNLRLSHESFKYYICKSCGVIFLHPIPENMSRFYPDYYPAYDLPTINGLAQKAEQEKYKLDLLLTYTSHGKLLEIGPAYGVFAFLAKRAGFHVDTMEMDERCCKFLSDVVGVSVINSTDICSRLNEATLYDVIALWHVIEHLPDPLAVIKAASEKLNPDGILIIATPNPKSLQFKIFHRFWAHLDAPRHLTLIPPAVLTKVAESQGLETALVTTRDEGSVNFSRYNWWDLSVSHAIRYLYSLIKKESLEEDFHDSASDKHRTAASYKIKNQISRLSRMALRIIDMPVFHLVIKNLQRLEGWGGTYTSVFKKH